MISHIHLVFVFCLAFYNVNSLEQNKWFSSDISKLGFSWNNCGSGSDPIQLKTLNISPDPIKTPGNITVSISVAITSILPTDIHVPVTLERKVGKFYIKVPCINNVGSCNYGYICEMWAEFCPKYLEKYGFPCQCPIPANTYTVSNANIEIKKKTPSQATGEYKLTANIGGNSGHLGCIKLQFKLKDSFSK